MRGKSAPTQHQAGLSWEVLLCTTTSTFESRDVVNISQHFLAGAVLPSLPGTPRMIRCSPTMVHAGDDHAKNVRDLSERFDNAARTAHGTAATTREPASAVLTGLLQRSAGRSPCASTSTRRERLCGGPPGRAGMRSLPPAFHSTCDCLRRATERHRHARRPSTVNVTPPQSTPPDRSNGGGPPRKLSEGSSARHPRGQRADHLAPRGTKSKALRRAVTWAAQGTSRGPLGIYGNGRGSHFKCFARWRCLHSTAVRALPRHPFLAPE